jgi:DNA repair protein SbcC/Rad50
MIKKIEIENFQSHKKTVLEFDAGVNVIIGESDAGKSAINKALNWVVNNRPSGEAFRSNWGGDTRVSIWVDDKKITRLKKGTTVNQYIIEQKGREEQIYNSFGQNVPDEVVKILNMSELNFQYQIDSPFLLSNTSGEVARYLNKVANLEEIDNSLLNADRRKKQINKNLESLEDEKLDIIEKLNEFEFIDEYREKLVKIEAQNTEIEQIKNDFLLICNIIENIDNFEKQINKLSAVEKFSIELKAVEALNIEIEEIEIKGIDLSVLAKEIKSSEQRIKEHKQILSYMPDINKIENLSDIVEKQINQTHVLSEIINDIMILEKEIQNNCNELKELENEFETNFPDICPLCGGRT